MNLGLFNALINNKLGQGLAGVLFEQGAYIFRRQVYLVGNFLKGDGPGQIFTDILLDGLDVGRIRINRIFQKLLEKI